MWRFILVTFDFLFFAFYELSGGADYAPKDGSRQAVAAERAHAAEQKRLAFLQAKPREKAPLPVAAEVITGGDDTLVLASAGGSALPLPKPNAVTLDQAVIDVAKAENLTEVAASASTNTAFGDDIREVTGGRVNLRRGPGTNFNAVGRLTAVSKSWCFLKRTAGSNCASLRPGALGIWLIFWCQTPPTEPCQNVMRHVSGRDEQNNSDHRLLLGAWL